MVQESTGNCLGSDVRDRDGLRPAGEPVDTYQQVSLSVAGWQWADDVQVDMIKGRDRVGSVPSAVEVWNCILERWQATHSRAQRRTSRFTPGQTNFTFTSLWVALIPG